MSLQETAKYRNVLQIMEPPEFSVRTPLLQCCKTGLPGLRIDPDRLGDQTPFTPESPGFQQKGTAMIPHRPEYAASLLRLALGVLFIAHGLLKVLVFTVPGTVAFFQSIGLPGVLAYVIIAAELLGGTALIIGFLTR